QELSAALEPANPRSSGLSTLRAQALERVGAPEFQALAVALPELRATLDRIGSVTVGINFTRDLTPDSATILSITPEKIEGRGPFLDRLFGKAGSKGISPVYRVDVSSFQSTLLLELRCMLEDVVGSVQE